MRAGRGGPQCGNGRRGRCGGLATTWEVGLRVSGGGCALTGRNKGGEGGVGFRGPRRGEDARG